MSETRITADTAELNAQIGELSEWLTARLPERSPEIIKRLFNLLDGCIEIASVQAVPAFGTRDVCIRLKLSDRLVEFIAALRAG